MLEGFVTNQKKTNKYLKPFVSAEQVFAKVRRLPVCGEENCYQKFSWPSESELRGITLENLAESKLKTFRWHISGSLWSISLEMTDGRCSGQIGKRNELDKEFTFGLNDKITKIELLKTPMNNYCQGLKLHGIL
jgi:hypothetical protein